MPNPDDRRDDHPTEEVAAEDTAEDRSDGMGAVAASLRAVNPTLGMAENGSDQMGATTASLRAVSPSLDMAEGGTERVEYFTSLNVVDKDKEMAEDVKGEIKPTAPFEQLFGKLSELSLKDE